MTAVTVLWGVPLLVLFWAIGATTRLLRLRKQVQKRSGQIAVQRERQMADAVSTQPLEDVATLAQRVHFARQAYNDSVRHYNAALGQFPGSLLARLFGFRMADLLPQDAD
ncbi:LemA family protein [Actimicrobium sp. CCC2.4]|uniref:LemA family protein n=1 Tax=Actimicrobium sp. CCC2.4 TaxID=3048606 RepID=UPI002AC8B196|nr:LemA family protein [Actimicrobium sp. CCC2.4]MEB0134133.1 LemA family protein [Actimicrobium sp. CCC2.4]WPX32788.1 LemA family protein [Actimicrobium sp. CCC2.4]